MKIFLDLDDVLNDFTMFVLRNLGCIGKFPTRCGYNIVAAANIMHPFRAFTEDAFWRSITRKLWATAPISDEFYFILDWACATVDMKNVYILTATLDPKYPSTNPDCVAGKLEWIQTNMPRAMQQQYFIGPKKQFCAGPDSLLIDDCEANIKNFVDAGGKGILVPRPWNTFHNLNTMDYLEKQFNA